MDAQGPELPPELRAFLYSCIDSVEQVQLLQQLRIARTALSVKQLAAQTGMSPAAIRRPLETLLVRGLLRADVGEQMMYRYAPETPELRKYADLLDEYYSAHRDAVVRAISSRAARTFAGAFKFRKDQ